MWLDESGKRHAPIVIAGASRYLLKSFVGHAWILMDEDGNDVGHVVASDKPARVVIQ